MKTKIVIAAGLAVLCGCSSPRIRDSRSHKEQINSPLQPGDCLIIDRGNSRYRIVISHSGDIDIFGKVHVADLNVSQAQGILREHLRNGAPFYSVNNVFVVRCDPTSPAK